MSRWRWLAPLLLALVSLQALESWFAASRIWSEELYESVRNVYWLGDRRVHDALSSNVGWYGLLLVVYRTFGFTLTTAKAVRVALHAVSLACVMDLLARAMGWRRAVVPALAFGLSPVLLYFNTMQTSYAIDLQIVPLVLWLLVAAPADRSRRTIALHAAAGILAGIGALMWPAVLFYVPALAVFVIGRARLTRTALPARAWIAAVLGACLPFACALVYLQTRALWLNDPALHTGVFRGGGGALLTSPMRVYLNVRLLVHEFFTGSHSYSADLANGDFSGPLGIASVAAIAAMTPVVWRASAQDRLAVISALVLFAATAIAVVFAGGVPGLRRDTGCFAAMYVLFAAAWRLASARRGPRTWTWSAAIAFLALLPAHHALALVPNLRGFSDRSHLQTEAWFTARPTPSASLDYWARRVGSGAVLDCRELGLASGGCRYEEIYAAIAGDAEWNRRREVTVRAYDAESGQVVELSRASRPPGALER